MVNLFNGKSESDNPVIWYKRDSARSIKSWMWEHTKDVGTKGENEGCVLLNSKNEWLTPRLSLPNFVQNKKWKENKENQPKENWNTRSADTLLEIEFIYYM